MSSIISELQSILKSSGASAPYDLSAPPKPELGDFAYSCFTTAKEVGKNPVEVAKELVKEIEKLGNKEIIDSVQAFGPYVNFFLKGPGVAQNVLGEILGVKTFGSHTNGAKQKYLVEFGCPNPLKAFHLGHLKNLVTGESVARIYANAGYNVVRVNYQGDVGMHVARALWGIMDWKDKYESAKKLSLQERVEFLGTAYAHGATYAEKGDVENAEVVKYNDIVYENSDPAVMAIYSEARQWSLEYFDVIYKRLGTKYDKMYFESQMFKRGVELVQNGLKNNIFSVGEGGAIIFKGSDHGLHDRVFINSKGFPTYEAKETALAEMHFADFNPDKVIHVVGKEQTEYFKVVIKALEFLLPVTKGKEEHLIGGFLQLKGGVKMSSRKGNIVTGDQLVEAVHERVIEIMKSSETEKNIDVNFVSERVAIAALKYGLLKNSVSQDVSFDLEESISVSGDSGPYLLYIVARIKSILKKSGDSSAVIPSTVEESLEIAPEEKQLLLKLSAYPTATKLALETSDPSKIAHYLFEMAQKFNSFYQNCPVVSSEGATKTLRLALVSATLQVLEHGLNLLGIETVEEM